MAKNISLLGADYPNVPAVQLPKTGGGTATFVDPDEMLKTDTYTASTVTNGFAITTITDSRKIVQVISNGTGPCVAWLFNGKWVFMPLKIENDVIKSERSSSVTFTYYYFD